MKKSIALILSLILIAGLTACGKTESKETSVTTVQMTETTESTIVTEDTEATESTAVKETKATENTTAEITESTTVTEKVEKAGQSSEIFMKSELIKLGEHTYYPKELFINDVRGVKYEDHMLSQLEEADKGLHDDVYVHGIGESETKGKFRFFGMMMEDGVIFDTADVTCWYDPESGSAWSINYSNFRRTDFDKSGLINAEDVFDEVYQRASKSNQALEVGHGKISGTYLLAVNNAGRLYYRFTINIYSSVDVDAKTGEIIQERYWNGQYT